jgi:hypothetical protein
MGFTKSEEDPNLYFILVGEDPNLYFILVGEDPLILVLYVDDLMSLR